VPPTPSLHLFTGGNTIALAEELRRWKSAFLAKHGEANLLTLESRTLDFSALRSDVQTAPFIFEKRLILIEGIPAVEKEDMEELIHSRHEATILVFIEPKPDRRKSVVKLLEKEAQVRTFPMLSPKQLVPWISELSKSRGISIAPEVAAHLVARVGSDQWHLRNELLKLISFCSLCHAERSTAETKHPTISDVDLICLPSETHAVWVMNDLIGKGKLIDAVQHAERLASSGEDAFSLWNIFLYSIRTLATLFLHFQENPRLSPAALAKAASVNPLSVHALLPLIRELSPEKLLTIVESAVEADIALKTGGIRATAQEPIELQCMLERQILALAKN
jgi:DNA polymerase III delta subunit